MDNSRFLAGLIGPTLCVIAISIGLNQAIFVTMAEGLSQDAFMIVFAGILTLLAGLAIVMVHNVWKGWAAVITVFGWVAIVGGLMRILMPGQIAAWAPAIVEAGGGVGLLVGAAVAFVIGAFLSWKAFRGA